MESDLIMINTDMRDYGFYLYEGDNGYGQPTLSAEVKGTIKMAINVISQAIQDNVIYSNAQYIGLTHADINDKYVIQFGDVKLKVLYINPKGRYKQVYMAVM